MPSEAPETQARKALIKRIEKIFEAEAFPVRDDKLNQSLGFDGTIAAVSPIRMIPWSKDYQVNQYEILYQQYNDYNLEADPKQVVSPVKIEEYADRFRKGMEVKGSEKVAPTANVWFFTIVRLNYVDDPTGNKTRFEAYLTAWGEGPNY